MLILLCISVLLAFLSANWALLSELREEKQRLNIIFEGCTGDKSIIQRMRLLGLFLPPAHLNMLYQAPGPQFPHLQCEKKCSEWSPKFALPLQVFKVLSLQLNPEVTYDPTQRRKGSRMKAIPDTYAVILYPVEPEVSMFRDLSCRTAISITRWVCVLFLNSNHIGISI